MEGMTLNPLVHERLWQIEHDQSGGASVPEESASFLKSGSPFSLAG
jgi:hypothetical protein